jgi:hypothetical protein
VLQDEVPAIKEIEVSHRSLAVKHFLVSKAVASAQKAAGSAASVSSSTLASSGVLMLKKRSGMAKRAALLAAAGALSLRQELGQDDVSNAAGGRL